MEQDILNFMIMENSAYVVYDLSNTVSVAEYNDGKI